MSTSLDPGLQWRIGDRVATALASDTPVLERGTTVSLRFLFEGGKLHADGTLHDDGTFHGDLRAHYNRLRERLEFADAVVRRGVSHNGVPWFRERIPARAPIDSQVVYVKPAQGIIDAEPFWALVIGGETDHRPTAEAGARWLTLELFVLASGGRYGVGYGVSYGVNYGGTQEGARQALIDDLGGEVI